MHLYDSVVSSLELKRQESELSGSGSCPPRTPGIDVPLAYAPPPPSGVYGPGTTAFLMNENGDEGMEGSPSFDGGAAAGAGSAAAGRQRIHKSLRKAEERASKGDV